MSDDENPGRAGGALPRPDQTPAETPDEDPEVTRDWLESDRSPELTDEQREYIHQTARFERALLEASVGDRVRLETRKTGFAGEITKIHGGRMNEDNVVVVIDPDEPLEEGATHDVTIDYEGAYLSYYPHYIPYIVAGYGGTSIGDVEELSVEEGERDDERMAWPATEALRIELAAGPTYYLTWNGYGPDVHLYEAGGSGMIVNRGPNALSILLEALCEHDCEATISPIFAEEVEY